MLSAVWQRIIPLETTGKEPMMRDLTKRLGVLAVALVFVAGACGTEGGPTATTLDVIATDFAFEGVPSSFRGGTVTITFTNQGAVDHELAFVEVGDATLDELKRDFPALDEGGAFPDYFGTGVVPYFDVPPGESLTSTVTMPAGNYMLFCALTTSEQEGEEGPMHFELGMYQENVQVTEGPAAEVTARDGVVVARDYDFDIPDLEAGDREVVFRNDGPRQWHHFVLFEFPEGTEEQTAVEIIQSFGEGEPEGEEGPPPEDAVFPEEAGGSGLFSPRGAQTVEVSLQAGHTYVLACFIQDIEGGPPHAFAYGMLRSFTVR
jgi:plastocyanin